MRIYIDCVSHSLATGEVERAMRIAKAAYNIADARERTMLAFALGRYIPQSGLDFKKK
ncbi:hypothetical protein [Streptomyces sp. NPDC048551]|uniref:hypothetical protein n=1 Tax=Streptomyces sp. NPDC048551 TaxID=3155758 RepID=UPI00342BEA20